MICTFMYFFCFQVYENDFTLWGPDHVVGLRMRTLCRVILISCQVVVFASGLATDLNADRAEPLQVNKQ
jgi:hypothetical protein